MTDDSPITVLVTDDPIAARTAVLRLEDAGIAADAPNAAVARSPLGRAPAIEVRVAAEDAARAREVLGEAVPDVPDEAPVRRHGMPPLIVLGFVAAVVLVALGLVAFVVVLIGT